jgi:hypothetical protein
MHPDYVRFRGHFSMIYLSWVTAHSLFGLVSKCYLNDLLQ